jgi:plasmid stabilization system protein ParE
MKVVLLLPAAVRREIRDAIAFTLNRHGAAKARDYSDLTREALRILVREPHLGNRRPDIDPAAWSYPIKQPGRPARHMFVYEIVDGRAQIYAFTYDSRDLPAQWRARRRQ